MAWYRTQDILSRRQKNIRITRMFFLQEIEWALCLVDERWWFRLYKLARLLTFYGWHRMLIHRNGSHGTRVLRCEVATSAAQMLRAARRFPDHVVVSGRIPEGRRVTVLPHDIL